MKQGELLRRFFSFNFNWTILKTCKKKESQSINFKKCCVSTISKPTVYFESSYRCVTNLIHEDKRVTDLWKDE